MRAGRCSEPGTFLSILTCRYPLLLFAHRRASCPTLPNIDQAAVKSLALRTLGTKMPRHLFGGSAVVESLGEKARTRSFATPAFAGCAYRNVTNDSFLQRGTRPVNDSSPIG